jgi:GT2 family glycosyltransferase
MSIGVGLVAFNISDTNIERLSRSLEKVDLKYKVVVDNSPSDVKRSSFLKNGWEYIHRPENPGFGSSHNLIFNRFGSEADFHLVVNPDIEFTSVAVHELSKFMENNSIAGAVAPAVYFPNGDFQELRKLLPSPYGWFLRRFRRKSKSLERYNEQFELKMAPKDGTFQYPYMSGCFMLLRSEVLKNIGFFDDNIFMYGEDTDLSRRLWINGTPPYYCGMVSIIHDFAKGSHTSKKLLWIAIKSTLYYFNKWGWFDSDRKRINRNCLKQFNIKK